MNNKNPKISIIIPTKNEEEGIAKVLVSIPKEVKKKSEIIVVDNSNDLTPKIAKALGAKVIKVRKTGKGYAMKVGAKKAKGEILVFLDGDFTDPPQYIPKLLKKLKKYDLVLGARSLKSFAKDDKFMRFIFKYLYGPIVISAFKLIGWPLNGDPLAGFRVLRKETWQKLNLKYDDFRIETEMNLKALDLGLKIAEVPIPHIKRAGGLTKSKLVRSVSQWFKILNLLIKYAKDKKIKVSLEKMKEKLKEKIKNLKMA